MLERRPLGQVLHVFSHIRMTLRAERILLQVRLAVAHGGRRMDGARAGMLCHCAGCTSPELPSPSPALPAAPQGDLDTTQRTLDEASGVAALQWVPAAEMQGKGLSSSVKKVGRDEGGAGLLRQAPSCGRSSRPLVGQLGSGGAPHT